MEELLLGERLPSFLPFSPLALVEVERLLFSPLALEEHQLSSPLALRLERQQLEEQVERLLSSPRVLEEEHRLSFLQALEHLELVGLLEHLRL